MTPDDFETAVRLSRNGMSAYRIAKVLGVPRSTLHRRLRAATTEI